MVCNINVFSVFHDLGRKLINLNHCVIMNVIFNTIKNVGSCLLSVGNFLLFLFVLNRDCSVINCW